MMIIRVVEPQFAKTESIFLVLISCPGLRCSDCKEVVNMIFSLAGAPCPFSSLSIHKSHRGDKVTCLLPITTREG